MVSERCAKCGLLRAEWREDGGLGYTTNGQSFCCRNCAEGRGCVCK